MPERYDLVVIGAGPGGYVAALRAAQLGMRVACVERRATLGGTCLNVGCIPSKALLDSSEQYAHARAGLAQHGVLVGDVKLDLATLLERKNRVVKGLVDGVAFLFKKHKVAWVPGSARLAEGGKVAVQGRDGETVLEAGAILLATGSEPATLPNLPPDGQHVVGSTEALNFERVPDHLLVVGGGYIGLELGSVWARLGARVTVLEFLPRILPLTDTEIAGLVQKSLVKQGLTFQLATRVTGAAVQGNQVTLSAESNGEKKQFQGDKVLVAVGRRPVTAGLGLEEAGVRLDKSGRVPVDENYRTNVPGVYALGDLIAGPMLAHKAMEEGVVFAERLAGQKSHVNYDAIPSVIYTWPEVASVGKTEEELQQAGRRYRVGKFPFSANGRARSMNETEGVVKLLADEATDRLLGAHLFGPRVSEMIGELVLALEYAASAEDLARTCHAHPTLSEAVHEAALAVDRRTLHL